MAGITSVTGRHAYNSRGARTIEVDVTTDGRHTGRACAPSGASVGIHEACGFPDGGPEASLKILAENAGRFEGVDSADAAAVREAMRSFDSTAGYSVCGGSLAYAVSVAAADSAARERGVPLFELLSGGPCKMPRPLGNILGGGAHAGPGTPDIQEILVFSRAARTAAEAIDANLAVHARLGKMLRERDPTFTNGRGDEGGWAPRMGNEEALELAASAVESLGYTLGKEVALGVDFASSTQWDPKEQVYDYSRAGVRNTPGEQIEFASGLIERFKLAYAEDAVHEEEFEGMAEITARFPETMVTGDDLTVTNTAILEKAARMRSCSAAILKVNQAGGLLDALEFAGLATRSGIALATSHRSGESTDSQITHIGIATGSRLLKAGVVGGERVAKLNEMVRLSGHDLIRGMADA